MIDLTTLRLTNIYDGGRNCSFITKDFGFAYGYYIFPEENIFFCNIPKCASTSVLHTIRMAIKPPHWKQETPRHFTIVRNPLERFKSGLSYIGMNFSDYVKNNYDILRGPALMHLLPQTSFIQLYKEHILSNNNLEYFHMGNIDSIFNKKVELSNHTEYSESFNIDFYKTYKGYKNWFEDTYQEDIELYKKVVESN